MTGTAALYGSIWIALALFAAGELGRAPSRQGDGGGGARWAWPVSAAGLAVAMAHVLIAFGVVHGWSHASAMAAAARQTEAVYGVAWGGGVFVNYAFLAVWAGDLWRWRRAAAQGAATRTSGARLLLRAFYLVIIVNGAIVFAAPPRRWIGAAIVATLVAAWRRGRQ